MLRPVAVILLGSLTLTGCESSRRSRAAVPLEWTSCPFDTKELDSTRIRCGYVTVLENRDDDRGRHLRLAFAVTKPSTPGSRDHAILSLSGGPGIPGLAPIFLRYIAPGLAENHDVVAFDQRGTGHSEPAMCPTRVRDDARISALNVVATEMRALKKSANLACRDELLRAGVDLRAYHSRASADDVEDIRRALGYDRWTVIGTSYGGALAQTVLSRQPERVRAAVLVVPVRFDDVPVFDFVRSIGVTLRTLSQNCNADSACHLEYPDLEAEFYAVAERLRREPMTVAVDSAEFGRSVFTVNAADFIGVIDDLTALDWELPFVPRVIRAFRDRDPALVTAAVERVFGGSNPFGQSSGMQMTVNCHDFAERDSRRRWQRVIDEFPLEGEIEFLLDMCEDWPSGRASRADREPAVSPIPTLILSGRFDNRAPPNYSATIMQTFRNSKQIVFTNVAHALPGPTSAACFFQIVNAFAQNPSAFPDGSCATAVTALKVSRELPEWARK